MLKILKNKHQQATCDTITIFLGYKTGKTKHVCQWSDSIAYIRNINSNFPSYEYYQREQKTFCPHAFNSEKNQKEYYPNITIKRYSMGEYLNIKFSVPKILYSSSINDASVDEYERLRYLLKTKLENMGIEVSNEDINYAYVSEVHPEINIWLPNKMNINSFFKEINKYSFSHKSAGVERFENSGQKYSAYSQKCQIVIYDKKLEVEKPVLAKIKYIDSNGQTLSEKTSNVLRLECRLRGKNEVKKAWERCYNSTIRMIQSSFDADAPSYYDGKFISLMKSNIWQQTKLDYWMKLIENRNIYRSAEPELYPLVEKAIQNKRTTIRFKYIEEMKLLINALQYEALWEIKEDGFSGLREKLNELQSIGKELPHTGIDYMFDYIQTQIEQNEAYAE